MTAQSLRAEESEPLVDGFGRVHRDLRISLTDRCSLRCTYCMPAAGVPCLPARLMLTAEEIVRVVAVAVDLGVTRVRLTGGEPLLRRDIVEIVAAIAALDNPPEIAMTTNGIGLAALAQPLADAGLARVNVSLDTLQPERFTNLTRRDRHAEVIAGLAAARRAGLDPIKLNAVLMAGINDDEACDLLDFALAGGYQLRFIEQMPLGPNGSWQRADLVTADDTLRRLQDRYELTAQPHADSAPASVWLVNGGPATVGIIGAVTEPFCRTCDRVRLTADGQLRSCLFAHDEVDLRSVLRQGHPADGEAVATALRSTVAAKPAGHGIGSAEFRSPERPMSAIGG